MKKYGLCFGGGGGKGSYELGVWKALKQLGKDFEIAAVSGASVGALNGLLFVGCDFEKANDAWNSITPGKFLMPGDDGYLKREALEELIDTYVDFDKVKFSNVKLYCNTAIITEKFVIPANYEEIRPAFEQYREEVEAEYFCLNDKPADEIKSLMLASSAIPVIYKPVNIYGKTMVDGGLKDNVPIRPLIDTEGLKDIIVVVLSPDGEYDPYLASRADSIIEIRPSRNIGATLDGTIDFNPDHVAFRKQLGFYDTLRAFDIKMHKDLGMPYSAAEIAAMEEKDYIRIQGLAAADNAVNHAKATMNQYDSMLDKYGKKYGIDLKNL